MKTKNTAKSKSDAPELIRFDWAMKCLLRQKSNFTVLEGFLSVLLKEEVKIISIKESESNRANADDKYNRVDILVENTFGELFIVEMQNSDEVDYFLRMLYAVSKTTVEHIMTGEPYSKLRKIYHINIVYFKLGQGKDYVYRGGTEFRGIHLNDLLYLTDDQKTFFEAGGNRKNVKDVKDLYPEYYILCIADFDDVAKDSLDEWIYYLKNNEIPDEYTAPGLKEVKQQLQYDKLSEQEKIDYDHHLKQNLFERNVLNTSFFKGENKGLKKGLKKGEAIGLKKGLKKGEKERARLKAEMEAEKAKKEAAQKNVVLNAHKAGVPVETIAGFTSLSIDEISSILEHS